MKQISYGAEAKILQLDSSWLKKIRTMQEFRHPILDSRLRKRRTKREFKVLTKLHSLGVNVPQVKDLDLEECSFCIEYIDGKCIVEEMSLEILKLSIIEIAKMHKAGIVHGDLTPLNILFKDKDIFLIDFGLSEFSVNREERAVDLNVFFIFLKNDYTLLYKQKQELLDVYRREFNDDTAVDEIFERLEGVERRGRNKNKN